MDVAAARYFYSACFVGILHDCDPGQFGANCSGICHCRSGADFCQSKDGRCTNGLCQPGWTDPPYCQTGTGWLSFLLYFVTVL